MGTSTHRLRQDLFEGRHSVFDLVFHRVHRRFEFQVQSPLRVKCLMMAASVGNPVNVKPRFDSEQTRVRCLEASCFHPASTAV